jgi:hypothetical protein
MVPSFLPCLQKRFVHDIPENDAVSHKLRLGDRAGLVSSLVTLNSRLNCLFTKTDGFNRSCKQRWTSVGLISAAKLLGCSIR